MLDSFRNPSQDSKKGKREWLSVNFKPENFIPGLIIGFLFGLFIDLTKLPKNHNKHPLSGLWKKKKEQPRLASNGNDEELKMVLVVRQDLRMGPGKIASQCAHAATGMYAEMMQSQRFLLRQWEQCGQPKIVLSCKNRQEMNRLKETAESIGLPTFVVADAGRTELEQKLKVENLRPLCLWNLYRYWRDQRLFLPLDRIISAISGGITDLSFHAVGYTWQIFNCFLTASYSLTLRRVMDTAKQVTNSGTLNEFSMVLLNNTLSLPLGLLLMFVFNEVAYLFDTPLLRMPIFWFIMTSSGVLGLAISFTSMWFLHQTGPTTYSLVGSLNKIPLSITGILLFKVPTSLQNFTSILFGLLAGVFFAKAKMKEKVVS